MYVKAATSNYTGQVFPAIGNHECTGHTKEPVGLLHDDQAAFRC